MTTVVGTGQPSLDLGRAEIEPILARGIPAEMVRGKKVLVLTPDTTRTCPLPRLVSALQTIVAPLAARLDFMVALGSHKPLPEEQILAIYGI